MRHLYLILISYLILTSFGVNSNTFRTHNPKLSILLNFRLSRGSLSTHQGSDGRHRAYYHYLSRVILLFQRAGSFDPMKISPPR